MKGRGGPRIGVGNGALGESVGLHWGRQWLIGVGNGSFGGIAGPHWGRQWLIGGEHGPALG